MNDPDDHYRDERGHLWRVRSDFDDDGELLGLEHSTNNPPAGVVVELHPERCRRKAARSARPEGGRVVHGNFGHNGEGHGN